MGKNNKIYSCRAVLEKKGYNILFIILFILPAYCSYGQKRECGCNSNRLMNEHVINCGVTILKNSSKLYWQFNCKRVWLTLEDVNKNKKIIDELPIYLFGYTYRLGYHLSKEYDKLLLFRSGCPANGPCNFVLVDKFSGKKVRELGELIYDHDTEKFYRFVIYFSSVNVLTLYYVDENKEYKFLIDKKVVSRVVPEYSFDKIYINNNVLNLVGSRGVIKVDLKK